MNADNTSNGATLARRFTPCAGRGDALDGARFGEDGWPRPGDGAQDSCSQAFAAPGEAVQGVDRSRVHEEDMRRRGAVHGSAGPGGGAVDRPEDADSAELHGLNSAGLPPKTLFDSD